MTNDMTKKQVFWPDYTPQESETFYLGYGQQITAVAMGLAGNDEITFEAVHVYSDTSQQSLIPAMPSIAASVQLRKNGQPVKLTAANPIAVIDVPQNFMLRAIRNVSETQYVFAWIAYTKSE